MRDESVPTDNPQRIIPLKTNVMGYYKEAKELYPDPLTFLRETLQNSLDGHAKRYAIDVSDKGWTISDDGDGMTKKFLEDPNGFVNVGATFKTSDQQRGNKGRGRLTYLIPITVKEGDELKYHGKVEILTSDGNRMSKATWRSFEGLDDPVEDMGPSTTKGTKIITKFDEKLPYTYSISAFRDYLKRIAVKVECEIVVAGIPVPKPAEPEYKVSGESAFNVRNLGITLNYPYEIGITEGKSTLSIAENGLLVSEIWCPPIRGQINFKYAMNDGERVGISTLSRDETQIAIDEITSVFITKGVLPYYMSLPTEKQQKKRSDILQLLNENGIRRLITYNDDVKNMFFSLVRFDGKSIKEWSEDVANGKKVVHATEYSTWVEKARLQGYTVIITDTRENIELLGLAGIKPIDSIMDELRTKATERAFKTPTEQSTLAQCAAVLATFKDIAPVLSSLSGNARLKTSTDTNPYRGSSYYSGLQENVPNPISITSGIAVNGTIIYLGEAEDTATQAFFYNGSICLNMRNPYVAEAVKDKDMDYLSAIVGHEYVHELGISNHDVTFASALTELMGRFMSARKKSLVKSYVPLMRGINEMPQTEKEKLLNMVPQEMKASTETPPGMPQCATAGNQTSLEAEKEMLVPLRGKSGIQVVSSPVTGDDKSRAGRPDPEPGKIITSENPSRYDSRTNGAALKAEGPKSLGTQTKRSSTPQERREMRRIARAKQRVPY